MIVISWETLEEVKEKAHKEGYSIISFEEISDLKLSGSSFLFQVLDEKTKEVKSGTIVGTDIFKVYVKLRKELGYQVLSLFLESDKNSPQSQKDEVLMNLKWQFEIFESRKENQEIKEEAKFDFKNQEVNISDFHLKKELDETYKLIEFVLKKLQNLIDDTLIFSLSGETKEKLKEIYNGIIKVRKTTNISKLKQIGEVALIKIGQIELENVEKSQAAWSKKLLSETNNLLKQIGSKEVFIEESKDIKKILWRYIEAYKETFSQLKQLKNIFGSKKEQIDKNSYSYLKTLLLLNKYKQRLSLNTKEIISQIAIFFIPNTQNKEKKELLLLKRRVIKQNISLLNAKKSWKVYSYTLIKKWYDSGVGMLFRILAALQESFFIIICFYSLFFLSYLFFFDFNKELPINFWWIFTFILVIFLSLVLSFSRSLLTLSINFVFLWFLFIFGMVNF